MSFGDTFNWTYIFSNPMSLSSNNALCKSLLVYVMMVYRHHN